MNKSINVVALQMKQNEHNRNNHTDVDQRNVQTQTGHYAIHFTKYVGKLTALNFSQNPYDGVKKVWLDTMLILLSFANVRCHNIKQLESFDNFEIPYFKVIGLENPPPKEKMSFTYFAKNYSLICGVMAAALDKEHHGECSTKDYDPFPFFDVVRETIDALFNLCVEFANMQGWDVAKEVTAHQHLIFAKKIK